MINVPLIVAVDTKKFVDFTLFVGKNDSDNKIKVRRMVTQKAIITFNHELREQVTLIEPGEYLLVSERGLLGCISEEQLLQHFKEVK